MACCGGNKAAQRKAEGDCRAGTELKAIFQRRSWLLRMLGVDPDQSCELCNDTARLMDSQGCDWCEANIEPLLNRIESNAQKLGVRVFSRSIVRQDIRNAIHNARTRL